MEHCKWQLTSCGEELTKSCANLCQLSEALPADLSFIWVGGWIGFGFSDGLRKIEEIEKIENPLESRLRNLLGKTNNGIFSCYPIQLLRFCFSSFKFVTG